MSQIKTVVSRTVRGKPDQFMLRLPEGLRERVKGYAKQNGTSLNTEIVMAILKAFPEPVEPETVNERLLSAAKDLMSDWTNVLTSLGQDPLKSKPLTALSKRIIEAENLNEEKSS